MSTFDDPNREAVGLPPIWTEGEPDPEPEPQPKAKAPAKKTAKNEDDGDD